MFQLMVWREFKKECENGGAGLCEPGMKDCTGEEGADCG